jgi:hypothetical protein
MKCNDKIVTLVHDAAYVPFLNFHVKHLAAYGIRLDHSWYYGPISSQSGQTLQNLLYMMSHQVAGAHVFWFTDAVISTGYYEIKKRLQLLRPSMASYAEVKEVDLADDIFVLKDTEPPFYACHSIRDYMLDNILKANAT